MAGPQEWKRGASVSPVGRGTRLAFGGGKVWVGENDPRTTELSGDSVGEKLSTRNFVAVLSAFSLTPHIPFSLWVTPVCSEPSFLCWSLEPKAIAANKILCTRALIGCLGFIKDFSITLVY